MNVFELLPINPLPTEELTYFLSNYEDQKHILLDSLSILPDHIIQQHMKENNAWSADKLGGLFHHVDNIRYIYKECGLEENVPQWFTEKYGKFFHQ
jgi:hypothetical protein